MRTNWNYSDTAGSHQYVIYDETGKDLALVYNRNEESEANAKLIAAAPELLEALKSAREQLRSCQSLLPHGAVTDWEIIYSEIKKIDLVINKLK